MSSKSPKFPFLLLYFLTCSNFVDYIIYSCYYCLVYQETYNHLSLTSLAAKGSPNYSMGALRVAQPSGWNSSSPSSIEASTIRAGKSNLAFRPRRQSSSTASFGLPRMRLSVLRRAFEGFMAFLQTERARQPPPMLVIRISRPAKLQQKSVSFGAKAL